MASNELQVSKRQPGPFANQGRPPEDDAADEAAPGRQAPGATVPPAGRPEGPETAVEPPSADEDAPDRRTAAAAAPEDPAPAASVEEPSASPSAAGDDAPAESAPSPAEPESAAVDEAPGDRLGGDEEAAIRAAASGTAAPKLGRTLTQLMEDVVQANEALRDSIERMLRAAVETMREGRSAPPPKEAPAGDPPPPGEAGKDAPPTQAAGAGDVRSSMQAEDHGGLVGALRKTEAVAAEAAEAMRANVADALRRDALGARRARRLAIAAVAAAAAAVPAGIGAGVLLQQQAEVVPAPDPSNGWRDHFWRAYGRPLLACVSASRKAGKAVDCGLEVRAPGLEAKKAPRASSGTAGR